MGILDRILTQDILGRAAVVPASPATTENSRTPLGRAEQARLDRIREGLAAFRADTSTPAAVNALINTTTTEWLAVPQKRRPDPEASINNFGVGIGDHLCAAVGGHWVVAVFDLGTELAVEYAEDAPLLFPIARVAEQWGTTSDWVVDYVAESVRTASAHRAAPAPTPPPAAAQPGGAQVPSQAGSAHVDALAKRALDRGTGLVARGAAALVPFTLVEDGSGAVEVTQFAGEPAEALELARRHLRESAAVRAAVGWNGTLAVAGQRWSAVLVEAAARGESSLLVAQRHHDGAPVGPPQLVGRQAPIF